MPAHDKKLSQAIITEIDLEAERSGHTTVKAIRDKVNVTYPVRRWHPYDTREATNDYLSKRIREQFLSPISDKYIRDHLPHIKAKHRRLLEKITAWFFVRSLQEWVFALYASPDQWDEGQDMRVDMATALLEAGREFRERADTLRTERARSLYDLVTRK